jgi:hypothetical protein
VAKYSNHKQGYPRRVLSIIELQGELISPKNLQ